VGLQGPTTYRQSERENYLHYFLESQILLNYMDRLPDPNRAWENYSAVYSEFKKYCLAVSVDAKECDEELKKLANFYHGLFQ